jgi:hypothetical protein
MEYPTPPRAHPADPVELVRQLDAEVIRGRLQELDRERSALLVLLRAAMRLRRADRKAVAHAG